MEDDNNENEGKYIPSNDHKSLRAMGYVFMIVSYIIYAFGTYVFIDGLNITSEENALTYIAVFIISIPLAIIAYIFNVIFGIVSTIFMGIYHKHKWELILSILAIALPFITFILFIIMNFAS